MSQWARIEDPVFIVENQYFPLGTWPSLDLISWHVSAGNSAMDPNRTEKKKKKKKQDVLL